MSEYQRYEFMTVDRPLTKAQLAAVNNLSSHIEASATHALIEYHWGDFKHDPVEVLYKFFDGFLYWANWGNPRLTLRFPHGIIPAHLITDYDFDDFVTFTKRSDYDILDIHFSEMESPDSWTEYDLGSLISIREELMAGDLRALYIAWLACQTLVSGYLHDEDEEEGDEEEESEEERGVFPIPPTFGALTEAQQELAALLQLPQELLKAAAQHSSKTTTSSPDDFVAWIKLLPQNRRDDYLIRLARNESGLSKLLVRELRQLGKAETVPVPGECVPYSTLFAESKAIQGILEREKREQERLVRQGHLQNIHDNQDVYWRQIERDVTRSSSSGYDEAVQLLTELREAADHFQERQAFETRFRTWIQGYLRRPALIKRLQDRKFPMSEV